MFCRLFVTVYSQSMLQGFEDTRLRYMVFNNIQLNFKTIFFVVDVIIVAEITTCWMLHAVSMNYDTVLEICIYIYLPRCILCIVTIIYFVFYMPTCVCCIWCKYRCMCSSALFASRQHTHFVFVWLWRSPRAGRSLPSHDQ